MLTAKLWVQVFGFLAKSECLRQKNMRGGFQQKSNPISMPSTYFISAERAKNGIAASFFLSFNQTTLPFRRIESSGCPVKTSPKMHLDIWGRFVVAHLKLAGLTPLAISVPEVKPINKLSLTRKNSYAPKYLNNSG